MSFEIKFENPNLVSYGVENKLVMTINEPDRVFEALEQSKT